MSFSVYNFFPLPFLSFSVRYYNVRAQQVHMASAPYDNHFFFVSLPKISSTSSHFFSLQISQGKLCTPSTWGAIGGEAQLS